MGHAHHARKHYSLEQALQWITQIAKGLRYLHTSKPKVHAPRALQLSVPKLVMAAISARAATLDGDDVAMLACSPASGSAKSCCTTWNPLLLCMPSCMLPGGVRSYFPGSASNTVPSQTWLLTKSFAHLGHTPC